MEIKSGQMELTSITVLDHQLNMYLINPHPHGIQKHGADQLHFKEIVFGQMALTSITVLAVLNMYWINLHPNGV